MRKSINTQKGNVLFMILLAVALFAALAYAVTGSTRSGGGDASRETTQLLAAQIVQQATVMENSIMRMKLSNGCTDSTISFENSIVSGYTNSNAPASKSCHVFDPAGGNVPFPKPPVGSVASGGNWFFSGAYPVDYLGTPPSPSRCVTMGAETPNCTELIAFLPQVTLAVCLALNTKLGITNPSGAPPVDDTAGTQFSSSLAGAFTGTYGGRDDINVMGMGGASLPVSSGCYEDSPSTGYYNFFHVLITR